MADDWFKPGSVPTPQPAPTGTPRRSGPSLVRLVLFAVIAFWIFSKFNAPPVEGPEGTTEQPAPRSLPERDTSGMPPLVPPPGMQRPQPRESSAQTEARPMPEAAPSTKESDEGDWSLEEVGVDRPAPVDDSEVIFDAGGSVDRPPSAGKKTTKGDWSLEEVEGK